MAKVETNTNPIIVYGEADTSNGALGTMELRHHPKMTHEGRPNWPPQWMGPYGPDNPLPVGEVGVLLRVKTSNLDVRPYFFLVIRHHDQTYSGSLFLDDENFLRKLCDLLNGHVGKPISEIGGLHLRGTRVE